MSTTSTNGRPFRKTLATQLDRLDGIIDTLAGGLNSAVADAVRDAVTLAVQQAVEAVLREVLSRPELLRQLSGPAIPIATQVAEPQSSPPSKLKRLMAGVGAKIGNAWSWLRTKMTAMASAIGTKASSACSSLGSTLRGMGRVSREMAGKAWELRKPVAISLGIGLVAGGIAYLAGPLIASLALGMGSSAASLLGILAAPYVRMWRSINDYGG